MDRCGYQWLVAMFWLWLRAQAGVLHHNDDDDGGGDDGCNVLVVAQSSGWCPAPK